MRTNSLSKGEGMKLAHALLRRKELNNMKINGPGKEHVLKKKDLSLAMWVMSMATVTLQREDSGYMPTRDSLNQWVRSNHYNELKEYYGNEVEEIIDNIIHILTGGSVKKDSKELSGFDCIR